GDLADAVWRQRPQGVVLRDRRLVRPDVAVLLAGAADVEAGVEAVQGPQGLEEVDLTEHVRPHRGRRRRPRSRHEGLCRQMEDPVRPHRPEGVQARGRVEDVHLHERDVLDVGDVLPPAPPPVGPEEIHVPPGQAELGEMAPHETGDARDQDPHFYLPLPLPAPALAGLPPNAGPTGSVRPAAPPVSSGRARYESSVSIIEVLRSTPGLQPRPSLSLEESP